MRTPFLILFLAIPLLGYIFGTSQRARNVSERTHIKLVEWEKHIPQKAALDTTVSHVSVAWHLDHGLKVINSISTALQKSDPSQFKRQINFTRMAVFLGGAMPRGVGKAPESVQPPEQILTEDILSQLDEARSNIDQFKTLAIDAHFDHPVFGTLNRDQVLRFLEIHTEHHLKIIRDILKAKQ
ncbi:MAG: DUF1569 domain-containing protein [Bacteroidia bacterium]